MKNYPLLSLITIISISLAQFSVAKGAPLALEANEGAVVFMMDSNYPNFLTNSLRVVFKKNDSLEFKAIFAKRKGKITVAKLSAGEYRLLKLESDQYFTNLDDGPSFTIEEGKATYVGDIKFMVNVGFGRNWRVDTFEISDNADDTLEILSSTFSGVTINSTLPLNWQVDSKSDDNEKHTSFKPTKKNYTGNGLIENGLLVLRLASKKPQGIASLGLGSPEVARINFKFKAIDGSNRSGIIEFNAYNVMTGISYKKLDKYTRGGLVALELPPGDYSINKFEAILDGGTAHVEYYNTIDTELPFSVKAGKITYLGEVYGNALKKKLLLFNMAQSVEFYVNDFWERDQKELIKKYPFLKEIPAETRLLEGKDGWEQIFHQGVDPRSFLKK